MRTVKEFILDKELNYARRRLDKLIELGAPTIMIEGQRKAVAEMEQGNIKIGGDAKLLDTTFEEFVIKTGRGGKSYVVFDNGVKFFPNARYGIYVTED